MTAAKQLEALQFAQLEHDRLFHPDILRLPTQRRANHMVLHFAKYAGRFAAAKQNKDRARLIGSVVDTFIICLATANMFNKRVADFASVAPYAGCASIHELTKRVSASGGASEDNIYGYVSENMAIEAGKMCKAIESLDHLENYHYVDALLDALEALLNIVFVSACFLNIDLVGAVENRLDAVERKSIFYELHKRGVSPMRGLAR